MQCISSAIMYMYMYTMYIPLYVHVNVHDVYAFICTCTHVHDVYIHMYLKKAIASGIILYKYNYIAINFKDTNFNIYQAGILSSLLQPTSIYMYILLDDRHKYYTLIGTVRKSYPGIYMYIRTVCICTCSCHTCTTVDILFLSEEEPDNTYTKS